MSKTYRIDRTAILDGDILAYQAAAWARSQNMDALELESRLDADVNTWMDAACANQYQIAFSCSRSDNFRCEHWPSYKAHRDDQEDPPLLGHAKEYLGRVVKPIRLPGLEADDILSILGAQAKPLRDGSIPVMVTIDKDLRQVPGWHVNPHKEDHPVLISEDEADLFLHRQWLSGDSTDGVPGLWRWGPAKASAWLEGVPAGLRTQKVLEAFQGHARAYPTSYALAMLRCIRLLRREDWDTTKQRPNLVNPTWLSGYPTTDGHVSGSDAPGVDRPTLDGPEVLPKTVSGTVSKTVLGKSSKGEKISAASSGLTKTGAKTSAKA